MKKYWKWLVICLAVFLISLFAHECGHGIANAIAGIPCSTGFNRVGDIYKFPSEDGFREYYDTAEPVLIDFGVPCTILLSITGTTLYIKARNARVQFLGAALAIDNCLLRSIPCSLVFLIPLITGNPHVEDEYETGQLLVQLFGNSFWLYIPAFLSWVITAICLFLTIRTTVKRKIDHAGIFSVMSVLAMCIGFSFAMVLDNFIRINWKPFI